MHKRLHLSFSRSLPPSAKIDESPVRAVGVSLPEPDAPSSSFPLSLSVSLPERELPASLCLSRRLRPHRPLPSPTSPNPLQPPASFSISANWVQIAPPSPSTPPSLVDVAILALALATSVDPSFDCLLLTSIFATFIFSIAIYCLQFVQILILHSSFNFLLFLQNRKLLHHVIWIKHLAKHIISRLNSTNQLKLVYLLPILSS